MRIKEQENRRRICIFIKKETLAPVFSCEFCEIPKNTFSYKTPPVPASGIGEPKENRS